MPWRRTRVVAALGLLWLSLVAVDLDLHRCLHEDAGQPDHVCVLTLLAQGQADLMLDAPCLALPPGQLLPGTVPPCHIESGTVVFLPPGRGPPSV